MIEQGSGVILALNSGSANGSLMMGSTGPADAATDTFLRNLAAEFGPRGVRVLGIWTAEPPETLLPELLAEALANRGITHLHGRKHPQKPVDSERNLP